MTSPLAPGATIGILGGGQLGRMLAVAASRLGFKTAVFEPGADCPARQVVARHVKADYDDIEALRAFAASVDVVTYEFENIPTAALDAIEEICVIHPGRKALATSQDRLVEKEFLQNLGLAVAPFANIESAQDLDRAALTIGTPSILKTRRFGYDGKGQVRLKDPQETAAAWDALAPSACVLEAFMPFTTEISVIGARTLDGQVVCFDVGENTHRDGILHSTTVPARLPMSRQTDAVLIAGRILNALDYVGVMGVELFVTPDALLVNEIAPRVHNSGHWTQNGCSICQFEQHIRAIAGWPLGDGQRHSNVVMTNLIGDAANDIDGFMHDPTVGIHLYGKTEARAGRKMGHLNRISQKG